MQKRNVDVVVISDVHLGTYGCHATDLAIENGYQYVVCGHIHKPQVRECVNEHGNCVYLNSGDWVENLTALEYANSEWRLHRYQPSGIMPTHLSAVGKREQEQEQEHVLEVA